MILINVQMESLRNRQRFNNGFGQCLLLKKRLTLFLFTRELILKIYKNNKFIYMAFWEHIFQHDNRIQSKQNGYIHYKLQ